MTQAHATRGEKYGSVIVEILKFIGVGVSRQSLSWEFRKRTGLRSPEVDRAFSNGLAWARNRSLIIPNTRRHRGELSYWRYCGDEEA